jgi:hypothetical protein
MQAIVRIAVIIIVLAGAIPLFAAGQENNVNTSLGGTYTGLVESNHQTDLMTFTAAKNNDAYDITLECGLLFPGTMTVNGVPFTDEEIRFDFQIPDEINELMTVSVSLSINNGRLSGIWSNDRGEAGLIGTPVIAPSKTEEGNPSQISARTQ